MELIRPDRILKEGDLFRMVQGGKLEYLVYAGMQCVNPIVYTISRKPERVGINPDLLKDADYERVCFLYNLSEWRSDDLTLVLQEIYKRELIIEKAIDLGLKVEDISRNTRASDAISFSERLTDEEIKGTPLDRRMIRYHLKDEGVSVVIGNFYHLQRDGGFFNNDYYHGKDRIYRSLEGARIAARNAVKDPLLKKMIEGRMDMIKKGE